MGLTHTMLLLLGNQAAGLLPFTDDFARADGDLGNGWEYTTGKWTISNGAAIAAPGLGPEQITNGSMEAGDPPTGWTANAGATLTAAADERTGGAGTQSLNAQRGTSNGVATQAGTNTLNDWVRLAAWVKRGTAASVNIGGFAGASVTSTSTIWDQIISIGRAQFANFNTVLGLPSTGGTGRYDDVSRRHVTVADIVAARQVGSPYVRAAIRLTMSSGAAVGVVVALDDPANPQNFIAAYKHPGGIVVEKCVGGTYTLIPASTDITSAATVTNALLELEYQSSGIVRVYYEGKQVGVDWLVTDAGLNGQYVAMLNTDPTSVINAFDGRTAAAPIALNGSVTALFKITTDETNLWTTSGSDDWLGRPVLADAGDKWIAIYRAATAHSVDGAGKFHIRFSEDEGANWTAEDTFTDSDAVTGAPFAAHAPNTDVGDAIVFVAPNGDLLVHAAERGSTACGTYQFRSTNGGKTWTDEGAINNDSYLVGGQDYTIVGSDIYAVFMETVSTNGVAPWLPVTYKSSDSGATWVELGTIEPSTTYGNEAGIIHTGGTRLLAVMRDYQVLTTYQYVSDDLGQTWSARQAIPDMGQLQRPRMKAFSGGILLYGRDQLTLSDRTVVWYSADGGTTWGRKFYTGTAVAADTGYCDVLERSDGKFYIMTYGGTTSAAGVRYAVFEIA